MHMLAAEAFVGKLEICLGISRSIKHPKKRDLDQNFARKEEKKKKKKKKKSGWINARSLSPLIPPPPPPPLEAGWMLNLFCCWPAIGRDASGLVRLSGF